MRNLCYLNEGCIKRGMYKNREPISQLCHWNLKFCFSPPITLLCLLFAALVWAAINITHLDFSAFVSWAPLVSTVAMQRCILGGSTGFSEPFQKKVCKPFLCNFVHTVFNYICTEGSGKLQHTGYIALEMPIWLGEGPSAWEQGRKTARAVETPQTICTGSSRRLVFWIRQIQK